MSKIRHDFRNRGPLPGSRDRGNGLDADRYWRCANCGWICKLGRDSLGGTASISGSYPNDYVVKEDPTAQNADPRNALQPWVAIPATCSMETLNSVGVIHQTRNPDQPSNESFGSGIFGVGSFGGDSDFVTIRRDYAADVTAGCPLCGSLNWRGDN